MVASGVIEELRTLFRRGDYETVVSRAEQLQHRSRGARDNADRPIILAAQVAALIQLGRPQPAAAIVKDLATVEPDHSAYPVIAAFMRAAQPYIAWASNEFVTTALDALRATSMAAGAQTSDRPMEAQLLYRVGRYGEAADLYRVMLDDASSALQKHAQSLKSQCTTARSWSITGRRSALAVEAEAVLTAEQVASLQQSHLEISTNLMAALVLSGRAEDALAVKNGLGDEYEVEYNAGCAAIALGDWSAAEASMEKAEKLFRAVADEDEEDDVCRGLAPILVQKAYLSHVAGGVAEAEKQYSCIVSDRNADPASLAVAANNAAVAMGQLSLGKQQQLHNQKQKSADQTSAQISDVVADRERHMALFDALKKMKATSGWEIERKLTHQQRRAMARNRAILLVQMGRLEACRTELEKLKTAFPDDPLLPLIEAALVAKKTSPAAADKLLRESADSSSAVVRAARVVLAADAGDANTASFLLHEMFPGRAAAIATSASILEMSGNVEAAVALVERAAADHSEMTAVAKRALAGIFLRAGKYEDAATVLSEVLALAPSDELTLGQLVVASSHFDADEAERLSEQLPALGRDGNVDADALEALPPPRKRTLARASAEMTGSAAMIGAVEKPMVEVKEVKKKAKKKLKKNKKSPKDYDPEGPPPDPERWLPKTLRSSHKNKNNRKNRGNLGFRGAQGADAASAEAAAVKNAERSAQRAAETASDKRDNAVPKGTKNKKKRR
jgi:tetratricopeptide (TPR) repeat protein